LAGGTANRRRAVWACDVTVWAGPTVSPEDADRLLWGAVEALAADFDADPNGVFAGVPEAESRELVSADSDDEWGQSPHPRIAVAATCETRM